MIKIKDIQIDSVSTGKNVSFFYMYRNPYKLLQRGPLSNIRYEWDNESEYTVIFSNNSKKTFKITRKAKSIFSLKELV